MHSARFPGPGNNPTNDNDYLYRGDPNIIPCSIFHLHPNVKRGWLGEAQQSEIDSPLPPTK